MRKGKSLIDFTNLFSPNNLRGSDKKILKHINSGESV